MKNIISSFTLPNGSVLKNRIAKSAMSENFGTRNHAPSKGLINTYKVWAKGNPGLLITGNIMVDSRGGFTEKESMEVIRLLGNEGIDLIEISVANLYHVKTV